MPTHAETQAMMDELEEARIKNLGSIDCMGHTFDPDLKCSNRRSVVRERHKTLKPVNWTYDELKTRSKLSRQHKNPDVEGPRRKYREVIRTVGKCVGDPCARSWFAHQQDPQCCPYGARDLDEELEGQEFDVQSRLDKRAEREAAE